MCEKIFGKRYTTQSQQKKYGKPIIRNYVSKHVTKLGRIFDELVRYNLQLLTNVRRLTMFMILTLKFK